MKSTPNSKKFRKKRKDKFPKFSVILILTFSTFLILYVYKLATYQLKPVVETPISENKKIPDDVNKNSEIRSYKVPILMYHYVENITDTRDTFRKSMNIEPPIFEAQIKTLKDNGYTFMTASELSSAIDGYRMFPDKPVLITFDDGHFDNATVVLPILKKYHAKATFYLVSNLLNGSDFLSDTQTREIINSKLVEIGSHTVNHVGLSSKLNPIVVHEVTQSKNDLEKRFGIHVVSFAYPNGDFDIKAIKAVKNAGYTNAVSTVPGISQNSDNKYFLYRLRPGLRTGDELIKYFNQKEFKPYG